MSSKPDPVVNIVIPAAQATLSGVLLGAAIGSLATVAGWDDPLSWGVIGMTTGTLAAWLIYRTELLDRLNPAPDPVVEYTTETTRINVILAGDTNYPRGVYLEIGLPAEKIRAAATHYLKTQNLSMTSMAGSGRPLSRAEYCVLRDELLRRELAYWLNADSHSQGVALNVAGGRLMRRLAGEDDSPTPHQEPLPAVKMLNKQ